MSKNDHLSVANFDQLNVNIIFFLFFRIWKEYEPIHNNEELQIQSANIFGRKMSKHALAILLNYSDSNSRRSGPFIKVSVTLVFQFEEGELLLFFHIIS